MRIVVVGAGKVGRVLTEQLAAEKHDIVVIDQDTDLIESLVNIYDVRGVVGNGGCYDVQKDAFEDGADLLIATTSSDEINILACLVAKKLGVAHTIARIRNPEYETQLRFMRGELGLTMSINPEKAAAHEIARVLRFPAAMKLESFSKGRLELVEYRLPEGSALDGVRLLDIYRNARARVLICAVSRKGQTTIPSGDFELKTGDKIYVTAAPEHLSAFFQYLGVFRKKASTVMIVGASKMCYYLADELLHMGGNLLADACGERLFAAHLVTDLDRAVIDSLELITHIDIFGYQILVVDIFKNIQHLLLRYILIIELVFAVFIGEFIEAVSM